QPRQDMAQGRAHCECPVTWIRVSSPSRFATSLLGGCTVYKPAPGVYVTAPPTTFDRSWAAARSAMLDQGVRITQEDRGSRAEHVHSWGCSEPGPRRNNMTRRTWWQLAIGLFASALVATAPTLAQAQAKKPNILIIWGDDIGWYNVSAYNLGPVGYMTRSVD